MANKFRVLGNFNTTSNETINGTQYTVPLNKTICAHVTLIGVDTINGGGIVFNRIVAGKNTAGVLNLISGVGLNVVSPQKDSGYSMSNIGETVSGSTLTITIKGQTNKPILWSIIMDIDTI